MARVRGVALGFWRDGRGPARGGALIEDVEAARAQRRLRSDGVVIAGVSTRAFAESAWRAGFVCQSVDAFGDLDQKARVSNVSLGRDLAQRYSAAAAADISRRLPARAAAYVANFENHPEAVRRLAAGRRLLGNPPDVLLAARDLRKLADVVASTGARVPLTLWPGEVGRADAGLAWLRKPARGGGGSGIRRWRPGTALDPREVAQERIDGVVASMVFLADGGRAFVLGLTRQLAGDRAFGAPGFRYAGSLFPLSAEGAEGAEGVVGAEGTVGAEVAVGAVGSEVAEAGEIANATDARIGEPARQTMLQDKAEALADVVTAAFRLRGVNGLDFVLRGSDLFVLELNPRYPASAELVERATGLSIFEAHVDACLGRLPVSTPTHEPPGGTRGHGLDAKTRNPQTANPRPANPRLANPRLASQVWGKAIVYARRDVVAGDTRDWLDNEHVRDVPFAGERIPAGHAVCTVFAHGAGPSECRAGLIAAAQAVEARLRG